MVDRLTENSNFMVVEIVPGEDRIAIGLSRFVDQIEDFRGFWEKHFEPTLIRHISEQFEKEGASGSSGRWAPLTDAYLARKTAKYGAQPILVASGELKEMMTDSGKFMGQKFKDRYVLWTLHYGLYHQTGTKKMPARKMIDMTDHLKVALGGALHEWAFKAWREATKDLYRQSVIAEYDTGQAANRWGTA